MSVELVSPLDAPLDKRQRVLDAALKLFAERGFHGTAVPEIARAASVGTGTIYRHFATKEALGNALYRHWKEVFNAKVLEPMPASLSPREQFDLYWERLVRWGMEAPIASRFLESHFHEDYLDAKSRQTARIYQSAARAFVRTGIESGALRNIAPEIVVALMWGTVRGLMKQEEEARAAGRSFLDEGAIAASADAVWRAIAREA